MDAGTGFMWLQQAGCTKNQKLAPGHVHDADERSDMIRLYNMAMGKGDQVG